MAAVHQDDPEHQVAQNRAQTSAVQGLQLGGAGASRRAGSWADGGKPALAEEPGHTQHDPVDPHGDRGHPLGRVLDVRLPRWSLASRPALAPPDEVEHERNEDGAEHILPMAFARVWAPRPPPRTRPRVGGRGRRDPCRPAPGSSTPWRAG